MPIRTALVHCTLLCLTLALSACGGGGGNATTGSAGSGGGGLGSSSVQGVSTPSSVSVVTATNAQ